MDNNFLVPSYYDKFACLGSECRYTCCRGWPIHMRKQEYKDLMKARLSPEMKEKLRSSFGKLKDDPMFDETQRYAKIRMDEDGKCPILTKEGLCGLQIECGAERLPYVCKIYPRVTNAIANVGELHVRMSCEATVRMLVKMTEPIQFNVEQDRDYGTQSSYFFASDMPDENPLLLHYWSIKGLSVGILQNRFYTMPQRILYLGIVLKRLMTYEAEGHLPEVEMLLQGLMEQENSEALRTSLERLPADSSESAPLQFVLALAGRGNAEYAALFDRVIQAVGEYDGKSDSAIIQAVKYLKAREQYNAFCEKYPHVMENIAVALFHELSMPFGGIYHGNMKCQRIDIWRNYLVFCREFVQIQFVLGALVTPETSLDEAALMVASVMRQQPNVAEAAGNYVKNMEERGLTSIERLSILLKG